jgi:hypothetical protein
MAGDPREGILARLLVIATELQGVQGAVRNAADVKGLARPAFIIHDGGETRLDTPPGERQSRVARIDMAPLIAILVHADEPDSGSLLNRYRARFLKAVTADDQILSFTDPNGEIRYEGCLIEPAAAEAKERRMELNLVFTYVFRPSDL